MLNTVTNDFLEEGQLDFLKSQLTKIQDDKKEEIVLHLIADDYIGKQATEVIK